MKKLVMISMLASVVALGACSNSTETKTESTEDGKEKTEATEKKEEGKTAEKENNNNEETGSGEGDKEGLGALEKVGDSNTDDKMGTATLQAVTSEPTSFERAGVEYSVDSVKHIAVTDAKKDTWGMAGIEVEDGGSFDILQIDATVKNTNDQTVNIGWIDKILTSGSVQIEMFDEALLLGERLQTETLKGVEQSGTMLYPMEAGQEPIEWVELNLLAVTDADINRLADEETIKVEF